MTYIPNLRQLAPSRRRLRSGDIFVMQLPDSRFIFGRVIKASVAAGEGPVAGLNLIYVYRDAQPSSSPVLELLTVDKLLGPPRFSNTLPWSRGYFKTVGNEPLEATDLLKQHCFSYPRTDMPYVDEYERPLPKRFEPCGGWGVSSYRAIDDMVSREFGIPEALD